jgi:proton-dependent oligopeptide transporter, POT family
LAHFLLPFRYNPAFRLAEVVALAFVERLKEIQSGFQPSFWVANFTEIFERLAYYGTTAVLAIYLSEQLHFSPKVTGSLMGIFGFAVYFLPVLGGSLADRFGFRRSLLFAYLVLTLGYFLLGSLSAPWMASLRHHLGDQWLVLIVLLIPSLGPGLVKPCVAGTTALASTENVRSLGYSIYYTLVNIGGAVGPVMAWTVRQKLDLGIENVFRVAALSVFLMFWVTLLAFREPRDSGGEVRSVGTALRNVLVILGNLRFVTFLLISSGFYIVFWQIYISAPIFLRRYVNPNAATDLILAVESVTVISCQILVTYLTRRIPAIETIASGFLITALAWIILLARPSLAAFGVTLFVIAIGEVTQASRYYEYCSRLAPPGQQGLYMGYAFLPIAIGYYLAGRVGGYLVEEFGAVLGKPDEMWWVIVAIGVLTAVLMWLYGKIVKPVRAQPIL